MQAHKSLPQLLLALSLLLATPLASYAQVLYGSLIGNVTDPTSGAVPSARVEALNTATGVSRQTTTDEHGVYAFDGLQAGPYKVTVSAAAFATAVRDNVQLDANTIRRVDVSLEVAQLNQSVTVAADASVLALQADRVDVTTQITDKQVEDLPLDGTRNYQSLLDLVPGVTPPVASHSEAGNPAGALATNVNGASYSNNGTRIDGTVNGYAWLPEIIAYVPPAEAIQGVSVSTGNYDAEQGMVGGSAVNVTMKSGTNQYHGAAWEYNTISKLNAKGFFYRGGPNLPKYIMNQFGLALGGPIKRNKLFFFVDWERMMKRQALSGILSVATDQMRQGDFSFSSTKIYDPSTGTASGTGRTQFPGNKIPASRLSAAALMMTALVPEPNLGTGVGSNYFSVGNYSFNRDNVDIKINYNPTGRSSVFARYSWLPFDIFDPPELGAAGGVPLDSGQPGYGTGTARSMAVGGTYTLTPTLLIDGNVGYTRQDMVAKDVDINTNYGSDVLKIPGTNGPLKLVGGYPAFTINGYFALGNATSSSPYVFHDSQYVFAGNLSWVQRSHSLRFGFDLVDSQINHFAPSYARGSFSFTGGVTALNGGSASTSTNAWADFLLGLPQAMLKGVQDIDPATLREKSLGLYARDQWQVRRNLTVTYGTRYEYYPLAHRDHFGFDRYDPTTNLVLLGGLGGVPYDTGVHVGHGNFAPRLGIAYRIGQKMVIRTGYGATIDPNSFRIMVQSYPTIISEQLSGANSYSPAGSLVTGLPPVELPDITAGKLVFPNTLSIQTFPQTLRRGYIESYNFTIQREIGHGINGQAGYVGTHSIRQFAYVNINASVPNGGNAARPLYILYGNASDIQMLQPFNSSRYNSLQVQAVKRFQGASQLRLAYTLARAIDYADNSDSTLSWSWAPIQYRNKALAGYDRTHNLKLFGTYELPLGRGKRWLTGGFANKIAGGWQMNGVMAEVSGTPFTVASSATALNSPDNAQTANQVLLNVKIFGGPTPYFNPKAFAAPVGAGVFGNTGRDILRGPGYFNLNASVFRSFRISERFRLQFRTEAFGATNTPHFANPAVAVITNTGFGNITSSSGQRQLRFAMKLTY